MAADNLATQGARGPAAEELADISEYFSLRVNDFTVNVYTSFAGACSYTRTAFLFYPRHGEYYVFIVVRWSVCLSVCLSVNNITEKRLNWFWWVGLDTRYIGNIFRMFQLSPWTQDFFHFFSEESMPLSSIAGKRLNGFSWNFQKKTDMTQGATRNIFGMLRLTPWIMRRFIYFLAPCLFVILWKMGGRIFMKFLWNVRYDKRND